MMGMKIYWKKLTVWQRGRLMHACEKGSFITPKMNYSAWRLKTWGLIQIAKETPKSYRYEPTSKGNELVAAYLCARLNLTEIDDIEQEIKHYHEESWKRLATMWAVEDLGVYVLIE